MTDSLLAAARAGVHQAPPVGSPQYPRYASALASGLRARAARLCAAADEDADRAIARGLPAPQADLLRITEDEITRLSVLTEEIRDTLPQIVRGASPTVLGDWGRLRTVPKPLGVVLMVHEARPWLTFEAALMPVAVGNAAVVHGGMESSSANAVTAELAADALRSAGLPPGIVTVVERADRRTLRELLSRRDAVDAVLPRESRALIDYCRSTAAAPVIASGRGFNHLYVHRSATPRVAAGIAIDSKVPNPVMCNSLQLVLVDKEVAGAFTDALVEAAAHGGRPVTLRLDPALGQSPRQAGDCQIQLLEDHDLGREFLEPVLGVRVVDDAEAAVEHIRQYGSAHTEGVLTADPDVAEDFARRVDAATIVVNGSLRLHDGPTLGMGPELTLSSGRLHVRGPVTVRSLLTHSWLIEGTDTTREAADRAR
ncbi:glutamate-5-semialdehyde dehydrogenase [Streptomyces sp. NPDC001165]|uniref:glutamate-5-semialdehyde dehydrogenase n=1 Tax=Streptomyces sp. NPDC001165 TaxID=3364546 RepID=UPI00369C8C97